MVILDTGPLVALFDDSEPMHAACADRMKSLTGTPVTSWPVITEAFYLLGTWRKGRSELWNFILAGGVHIDDIPLEQYTRIRALMAKYADNPMDLADASLVVVAEIHKIKRVFTLDRKDFLRYRPRHCSRFEIIP
jgi:uncharacterized protein